VRSPTLSSDEHERTVSHRRLLGAALFPLGVVAVHRLVFVPPCRAAAAGSVGVRGGWPRAARLKPRTQTAPLVARWCPDHRTPTA